ncbi:MAG: hypothetical protein NTW16_00205 [Bacteroidetes bacterium]|nr:hypothetical protein [Bacteroidota bacterium]
MKRLYAEISESDLDLYKSYLEIYGFKISGRIKFLILNDLHNFKNLTQNKITQLKNNLTEHE